MTDQQINELITARNAITSLGNFSGLISAVDAIDRLLQSVPPGQRPDVDRLLGRPDATKHIVAIHRGKVTLFDPAWLAQQVTK